MCSYYTFTIKNTSDVATTVYLSLKTDTNTFDESFKYCVYEGNTTATSTQACKAVPTSEEQFTTVNLAATNGTKQYTIVLYYENTEADQTKSGSGQAYTGTVKASTSSGENKIVGYIAGA